MKAIVLASTLALTAAIPASSEATRYVAHGTLVSGPAAVRVWVDGGDVFADYHDVALYVRPDRDCYTSLFLVDTAGYIHVLQTGHDDGWLYGGRTYGYAARDLGLDRLHGRGIAYVFAVGSPVPFDYSTYGAGVRVGAFGYRVIGDPFVGCREFYTSLLPATCRWDYVQVNFTRFYVREWVRYPSYLCAGHVRVGDWCRHCEPVYATYRCNVAAPHAVLRPVRYKDSARYTAGVQHVVRARASAGRRYEPIDASAPVVTKDARRIKAQENVRVVSTSRNYARGARVEKTGATPVMAKGNAHSSPKGGHAEPTLVAGKSRNQKDTKLAQNTREKGAGTKTRQAE